MEVEVAPWGWLGEAWSASFPEDMPEAWRLDYLANAFDAVAVPASHWQGRSPQELHEWLEEAPERFSLYWEIAQENPEPLLRLYREQGQGGQPGGWLLSEQGRGWRASLPPDAAVAELEAASAGEVASLHVLWLEQALPLRELRERLDALAAAGTRRVLLLVTPAEDAEQRLSELHTFCQLYRS